MFYVFLRRFLESGKMSESPEELVFSYERLQFWSIKKKFKFINDLINAHTISNKLPAA